MKRENFSSLYIKAQLQLLYTAMVQKELSKKEVFEYFKEMVRVFEYSGISKKEFLDILKSM